MGMRLGSAHGLGAHVWRLLISALAVTLLMTLGATSASAAKSATCSVTNTDSGRTYPRLQQAVDAAKPGAHLVVKGHCHGGTFIDKSLGIVGKETKRTGKPVLDGDAKARVLTIKPKVKVSIRAIVIRDGRARLGQNGGGIANKGRLVLRDVVVRRNTAGSIGGGIYNQGVVRISGDSRVTHNRLLATTNAYGAAIANRGRLALGGTTRVRSDPSRGIAMYSTGTVVMNGRSNSNGCWNDGSLTMNDASSYSDGYSVLNGDGTLTMNDTSSIHDMGDRGGVRNYGSLTMNDASSIHDNHATFDVLGDSGGVSNAGILTMNDSSSIHDNHADGGGPPRGGGVFNYAHATLSGVYCAPHTYANVYGNSPDDCYFES